MSGTDKNWTLVVKVGPEELRFEVERDALEETAEAILETIFEFYAEQGVTEWQGEVELVKEV